MNTIPGAIERDPARAQLREHYLADEAASVRALLDEARLECDAAQHIHTLALQLIEGVRRSPPASGIDAFLKEYDLTTREGVVLMCLAEALLRIPDAATADRLIRGLILEGEWRQHRGASPSLFVNASTWGLMLTGRIVRALDAKESRALIRKLAGKLSDAALRLALRAAMEILGREFVLGETIEQALRRAGQNPQDRYSFDMLGEAALTARDAERYFGTYLHAIRAVGERVNSAGFAAPGVSIKLSALHPRYDHAQRERVLKELAPRLLELGCEARDRNVMITLDAEEADRLELSLDVFEQVFGNVRLRDWPGFGLAVQAYQKRAPHVIDWLQRLSREHRKTIPLRLVKGAYWDTEIKRAQVYGLAEYPVFTRKAHTDLSFLACGGRILEYGDAFYPQFATHNAHAVAWIMEATKARRASFEFQRLHGMGEALYGELREVDANAPCRVYAPVGSFDTLLAYLVRRLLENGANTSFVNRIADTRLPPEKVIGDPLTLIDDDAIAAHPRIPLPRDLYGKARINSAGLNLADRDALAALSEAVERATEIEWRAAPLIGGEAVNGEAQPTFDPADRRHSIGSVVTADEQALAHALDLASAAQPEWNAASADHRAQALERAADLFEANRAELCARIVREGGRTIPDALAEVREAIDYCRYYAAEGRRLFAEPRVLAGPAGEDNRLALHGRGVFACISPWNFPLAIFAGQVAAALAAGNAVIAKPAEQTPLVAMRAVELLHDAGIPANVLHFVPGSGETIGARLVADPRVSGVVFTGSIATAQAINRALAARTGAIVPLIAETGGMNAIIADSSALPEQLITDVVQSAFNSAGQRCSAARLLFIQEDIADTVIEMLKGAMAELSIGDPMLLATDVGPIIDEASRWALQDYCDRLASNGKLIATATLKDETANGFFFAPRAFEIAAERMPKSEVFGPVLHVLRWRAADLDRVIDIINATGFGLTLGVHSRIEETIARVRDRARVGNVYINRNIIGAVVGVQPFGGEGLSGTGPKAGGPHYLLRFALERSASINTAAVGGNATLLALDDRHAI